MAMGYKVSPRSSPLSLMSTVLRVPCARPGSRFPWRLGALTMHKRLMAVTGRGACLPPCCRWATFWRRLMWTFSSPPSRAWSAPARASSPPRAAASSRGSLARRSLSHRSPCSSHRPPRCAPQVCYTLSARRVRRSGAALTRWVGACESARVARGQTQTLDTLSLLRRRMARTRFQPALRHARASADHLLASHAARRRRRGRGRRRRPQRRQRRRAAPPLPVCGGAGGQPVAHQGRRQRARLRGRGRRGGWRRAARGRGRRWGRRPASHPVGPAAQHGQHGQGFAAGRTGEPPGTRALRAVLFLPRPCSACRVGARAHIKEHRPAAAAERTGGVGRLLSEGLVPCALPCAAQMDNSSSPDFASSSDQGGGGGGRAPPGAAAGGAGGGVRGFFGFGGAGGAAAGAGATGGAATGSAAAGGGGAAASAGAGGEYARGSDSGAAPAASGLDGIFAGLMGKGKEADSLLPSWKR